MIFRSLRGSGLIDQYSRTARIDIPQSSRRLQRLFFRLHLSVFGHIFYFLIMFILSSVILSTLFLSFVPSYPPRSTRRYDAVNAMLLNEFLKEHRKVQEQDAIIVQLKSTVAKQETAIAQQQKGMEAVTARLEEHTAQIQKVSARLDESKPAPQIADNRQ